MNKKKWALLVFLIALAAGYIKLFYKTWNNHGVPGNADVIIALDKKRIINTAIWNILTTPSQWKGSRFFPSKNGKLSWDDMVSLPDYVFIFHPQGQPSNAYYSLLEINNNDDFAKGLQQYHFIKTAAGSFISAETGIELIQKGNQLLVGNAAVEDRKYIQEVAHDLFDAHKYLPEDSLEKYVKTGNHLFAGVVSGENGKQGNSYFIKGNFDKHSLSFSVALPPLSNVKLASREFRYSYSSLLSAGFTQSWPATRMLLSDSLKEKISQAMNFKIDSLLLPSNRLYQLDIAGMYARTDSAVTYTYDDNFNPVEKVVVNTVEEPAFNFSVYGDSVQDIFDYWNRDGKFEKNGDSNLFTPVPFVRSFGSIKKSKELVITSQNYTAASTNQQTECIFFLRLLLTKIPVSMQHYFPSQLLQALRNIETAEAIVKAEKGEVVLHIVFNKKQNDLPLFE